VEEVAGVIRIRAPLIITEEVIHLRLIMVAEVIHLHLMVEGIIIHLLHRLLGRGDGTK